MPWMGGVAKGGLQARSGSSGLKIRFSVPTPVRYMATVEKATTAEATIREIIANHEVFAEGIAASMARYLADIENANFETVEEKYYDAVAIGAANKVMADLLRTVYPGSETLWREMSQQVYAAILSAKKALAKQARKGGF